MADNRFVALNAGSPAWDEHPTRPSDSAVPTGQPALHV